MARKTVRADEYEGYLYSTIGTGAPVAGAMGAFTQNAFSYAIGAAGNPAGITVAQADERHTNMSVANQLPDGVALVVKEVGFDIVGLVDYRDVKLLLDNLVATIRYDARKRTRELGLIKFWPGGMGVSGAVGIDGAAADTRAWIASNGAPFTGARRRFRLPIPVKGRRNFDLSVQLPAALAGFQGVANIEILAFFYGVFFNKISGT